MSALLEVILHNAAAKPDACAIICGDARVSYRELVRDAARVSNALAAKGVAEGDAIAVLAGNSIPFVTLMLAAADLGAMLAPLSPALPTDAIARAFAAADVRHVCAEEEVLPRVPSVPGVVYAMQRLPSRDGGPLARGKDEAPYILCMTSGSTGAPKAIVLPQRAKLERARAAISLYGVSARDRVLAATPLYHSLAERLVFTALVSGATLVLAPRYSPALWLESVQAHGVTFTIAVSTQLSQIARRIRAEPGAARACASLRAVVSSSAPLPPEDKALLLSTFPGELHECYGASEIAIATSLDLRGKDAPLRSVGRAAPGVAIRILDAEGRALEAGDIGEIACRTPMAFSGYHNRPDLTEAALADGYFRTGDLGRIDAQGALYYLGRTQDLIITGGVNVYPADVEAAVAHVPGVRECAAFGYPDDALGEVVAVAIVSAGDVTARAVRRACADALADFQHPRRIFFLDELPRNAMGKLLRRALPALVRSEAQAA
ncbi:MAG: acyl--CoA ligase [Hyphomonadaceae bacterium]|nr:acyl--CoA ligase [Hyphomonadaceae bacterium]